jgi:oxygen-independent coproporphyrinogen-3 oxidase
MSNNDLLFKQIIEKIAETDSSGYTIQYPPLFLWKSIKSDRKILRAWREIVKINPEHLGLYIHIPFCKQRCSYCRYFSVELQRQNDLEIYLTALKKEIRIYQEVFNKSPISSIYFGGGTPSLLNIKQLDNLFKFLYKNFNLLECQQIVFEGNPDFLDFKKLKLLKQWGVNRLTIGVQSLDPKVIKAVNRYQSQNSFLKCFQAARKAKIENINVDLMVGLPSQTINSALQTLRTVIQLQPEMIHVHPFYPTALSEFIQQGNYLSETDMNRREKMSLFSQKIVQKAGYQSIKFDASGKTDASRNIQLSDAIEYNSPFLGIGAGAVSHITNYFRYINTNKINDYINNLKKDNLPILSNCQLSIKDEMIYFVTACLRYGKVSKYQFKKMFNQNLDKVFKKEIEYLVRRGKIKNIPCSIISLMQDIGEYLVFSKYFYSQDIINKCKKELNWKEEKLRKITKEEFHYICL